MGKEKEEGKLEAMRHSAAHVMAGNLKSVIVYSETGYRNSGIKIGNRLVQCRNRKSKFGNRKYHELLPIDRTESDQTSVKAAGNRRKDCGAAYHAYHSCAPERD